MSAALLTPGADPVRKVSIIPRGQTLGITLSAPDADRFSYDEDYLRAKLCVLLGGRTAEHLVYGTVTTGAENDIGDATELARHMAGAWGMSDAIGPMTILPDPDSPHPAAWGADTSPRDPTPGRHRGPATHRARRNGRRAPAVGAS